MYVYRWGAEAAEIIKILDIRRSFCTSIYLLWYIGCSYKQFDFRSIMVVSINAMTTIVRIASVRGNIRELHVMM